MEVCCWEEVAVAYAGKCEKWQVQGIYVVFLTKVKDLSRTGVRASARAGAAEIFPKNPKP